MGQWHYERPAWVRRTNAMAGGIGGPPAMVPLAPDELIDRARAATGLDDFGPDDWHEPLRRLLDAIESEADLHVVGRLMTRHDLIRHLSTRLLLVEARRRDPSIDDEPITAPLFITGPARSGTSILHELLAEDPLLRAPRAWEMAHPVRSDGLTPAQVEAWATSEFDLWADVQPEFGAVHELAAHLPEECLWLTAPDIDLAFWSTCARIPSFMAWRGVQDATDRYRYHRSFLQVLQHGDEPRRWVLKSPVHLGRLPALFAVYPDAKVILTHRDPVKTLPSAASTVALGQWLRSDGVDPMVVGASVGFGFSMLLNGLAAGASALPDGQVAHLHYPDLLADPVGAIGTAYDTLGLPFGDDVPGRIERYLAARPQTKFGVHRYDAETFGLDPATIRRELAPYTETFAVISETDA